MHILLIHQAFAALDEPGGTRHHEFSRYLVSRGHRITIIASPVSYLTGSASGRKNLWVEVQDGGPGIVILRAYTYPALHRSFLHRAISFLSFMFSSFIIGLRVSGVDLIWGTSPPITQGLTAWLLARLKRVPFLFEVRDLWPAFAIAVGVLRQPALVRVSEWLERFLYRHADKIVVNSPGFIDHVSARGGKRIELIPNGADTAMFDPHDNGNTVRESWGLEKKFIALYAGAHGLSNDLSVLLLAADQLRNDPEIVMVLLGDGKEKASLTTQAKEMQLTNVIFLAPLPKVDIPKALAAADACIAILKPIPLYATVYPNKVFDYMAAGRPVVLAMEGVIQEVIEGAGAGITVSSGDPGAVANAIRYLATHTQESREMGQRGRLCIETRFNRSLLATRLEGILRQMVNKV